MGTLRGSPSNYSEHAWIRLHDDMTIQATDQGDKDRWSAVVIQAAMNNINEWLVRDSSCMFVWHGESWTMHDTEKSLWSAFRCQWVLYWGQACTWVLELYWIEATIAWMDFILLKGTMCIWFYETTFVRSDTSCKWLEFLFSQSLRTILVRGIWCLPWSWCRCNGAYWITISYQGRVNFGAAYQWKVVRVSRENIPD